jgi:hypothetical protein
VVEQPRTYCMASAYASPVAALMAPRMCARPAAADSVVVLRAAELLPLGMRGRGVPRPLPAPLPRPAPAVEAVEDAALYPAPSASEDTRGLAFGIERLRASGE